MPPPPSTTTTRCEVTENGVKRQGGLAAGREFICIIFIWTDGDDDDDKPLHSPNLFRNTEKKKIMKKRCLWPFGVRIDSSEII